MSGAEVVYLTPATFEELVDGAGARYYDRHLENLARIAGKLRIVHCTRTLPDLVRRHPRLGNVVHEMGSGKATMAGLVRWALSGRRILRGPAVVYVPFVSSLNLVVAVWKRFFPVAFYFRYTWREAVIAERLGEPWRTRMLKRISERVGIRQADWLGAGSEFIRDYAIRLGAKPERITITSNFIEAPEKRKTEYGLGNGAGRPFRIAFAGRLHPIKRPRWLLGAAGDSGVEVHLFGDGPLRSELERAAGSGRVYFHGLVPRDELFGRLAEMDLFAFPSQMEGVPKALLEAMAIGLPCVGCDVEGVGEWLADGRGLATGDNERAFLAGIDRLRRDGGLREALGRRAAEYVRHCHAPERVLRADREWVERAMAGLMEAQSAGA